jgi:enhancing lycopene biosynthesis protein 2
MKIRMKKEIRIATDGIGHVTRTVAINEVVTDLSEKMSQDFIDCDLAELVVEEEKKVTTSPDNKAIKSAPENKSVGKKKASSKKG